MSYSVLVADDSSFMRSLLSNIFKNISGVGEIRQAVNGLEVVEMYKKKKPGLVTIDMDMPEMNGIDATSEIKSFDSKANIAIVTSSDKKETRERADKIGIWGYLTKPFDRLKIKALIENIS